MKINITIYAFVKKNTLHMNRIKKKEWVEKENIKGKKRRTNRNWKLKTNNKYQRNGFGSGNKCTEFSKVGICLVHFTCSSRCKPLQWKQYDNIIHFTRLRWVNISVCSFLFAIYSTSISSSICCVVVLPKNTKS